MDSHEIEIERLTKGLKLVEKVKGQKEKHLVALVNENDRLRHTTLALKKRLEQFSKSSSNRLPKVSIKENITSQPMPQPRRPVIFKGDTAMMKVTMCTIRSL